MIKRLFAVLALLALVGSASAATVFSTTFNCASDWTGSMGLSDATVCANGDFILGYLNGGAPHHPNGDEINAGANNAAGGGGKGFRHWDGTADRNLAGGSIHFLGFAAQSEMWVRFYMRFQSGYDWSNGPNIKSLYVNSSAWQAPGTFYFGFHDGVVGGHVEVDPTNRAWSLSTSGAGTGNMHSDKTWSQTQSSNLGDGLFHCYEIHVKMNTTSGSSDGIYEFWFDGTKIYTATNVHFANTTGATWSEIGISANADTPSSPTGADLAVDYDDFVISNSGYIGPLAGGDVTPPTLTSPSAGTPNSAGTTSAGASTNEATGTLYWTTYSDGAATPLNTQVKAHTGTGVQGSSAYGSVSVTSTGAQAVGNISGLASSTAYDIYFVHEDASGNLSAAVKADLTTTSADVTPPTLSSASAGTVGPYGSTGPSVASNEGNGTLYWTTYVNGSTPLNTNVRDHDGTGAQVPSGSHGSLPVSGTGTQIVTDITGLTPGTAYDLWYVQVDAAGNLSAAVMADLDTAATSAQVVFFSENCEDNNFTGRGWYDIVGGVGSGDPLIVDATTHAPIGNAACKYHFAAAGTVPSAGYQGRHAFTPSETVYISWWMKLGTAGTVWQGSGLDYHPHMLRLFTDSDSEYISPNRNSLGVHIEAHVFKAQIYSADNLRIFNNGTTQPHDGASPSLMGSSAAHAVMGGNGLQSTASPWYFSDWYLDGGDANETDWRTASNVFTNNTWHHCEFYAQMNTITGATPNQDGLMKFWVDGVLVMNIVNLELRTGQYATQKFNQFAILPYIGDGSPIAQDFWLDNITVADVPGATVIKLPISIH